MMSTCQTFCNSASPARRTYPWPPLASRLARTSLKVDWLRSIGMTAAPTTPQRGISPLLGWD